MKKITITLLIMLGLTSSCNETMQTIEVTRLVPNTVEVTEANHQLNYTQESNSLAATPDIPATSPSIKIKTDSSSITMDPIYFEGYVVLTQFYTLLDHGLYEEAVSLFSLSKQMINGKEADINYFKSSLDSVKIRFILPFDYWLVQQGMEPSPPIENEIRYIVGTTVIYKGEAWNDGNTPVPYSRTSFISLILESGEWKIDEMNSSPWFSRP